MNYVLCHSFCRRITTQHTLYKPPATTIVNIVSFVRFLQVSRGDTIIPGKMKTLISKFGRVRSDIARSSLLNNSGKFNCNNCAKFIAYICYFVLLCESSLFVPVESREISRKERSPYEYRDPVVIDSRAGDSSFRVYWNVPSFQCKSHNVHFKDVKAKYGISQNDDDNFRGNKVAILYDPGNFPALLENSSSDDYFYRNGGVPQEGDLDLHRKYLTDSVEHLIPDESFSGVGVIDFESWRPIFRQNFGVLAPYKKVSYDIERKKHPLWTNSWVETEAKNRFEKAGRIFMEESIALVKKLRPHALWGYYAFPYCYNMNNDKKKPKCPDEVVEENNKIQWLWDGSDAFYPSLYMPMKRLNSAERLQMVKGRISEAKRLQEKTGYDKPILPYFWYKYSDETDQFLTKDDIYNSFKHMKNAKVSGVILWGSSNDVNSKQKCLQLRDYVDNVLGPTIKQFVQLGNRKQEHQQDSKFEQIFFPGQLLHVLKNLNYIDEEVIESMLENNHKEKQQNVKCFKIDDHSKNNGKSLEKDHSNKTLEHKHHLSVNTSNEDNHVYHKNKTSNKTNYLDKVDTSLKHFYNMNPNETSVGSYISDLTQNDNETYTTEIEKNTNEMIGSFLSNEGNINMNSENLSIFKYEVNSSDDKKPTIQLKHEENNESVDELDGQIREFSKKIIKLRENVVNRETKDDFVDPAPEDDPDQGRKDTISVKRRRDITQRIHDQIARILRGENISATEIEKSLNPQIADGTDSNRHHIGIKTRVVRFVVPYSALYPKTQR